MMDLDRPLWQLTVGEFMELASRITRRESAGSDDLPACDENMVYHLDGIARLLGCSKTTVHEYRKQGWIEPAIKQVGRKIICDARLALKLFGEYRENSKK